MQKPILSSTQQANHPWIWAQISFLLWIPPAPHQQSVAPVLCHSATNPALGWNVSQQYLALAVWNNLPSRGKSASPCWTLQNLTARHQANFVNLPHENEMFPLPLKWLEGKGCLRMGLYMPNVLFLAPAGTCSLRWAATCLFGTDRDVLKLLLRLSKGGTWWQGGVMVYVGMMASLGCSLWSESKGQGWAL